MGLTRSEKSEILDLIKETLTNFKTDIIASVSEEINKKLEQKLEQVFGTVENKISRMFEECIILRNKMDSLEQYTRRNSIRLFGVPEQENEDTLKLVKEILTEKMELPETCFLIDRCHRLKSKNASKNNATNARPNAIIIKFMSYNAKMSVNQRKKALKGTGWVITDDLTSNRASKNNATNARPNAIIIKFMSYNAKMSVNQRKKALKGTGWVITDDLTSNRHALYRSVLKKFGRSHTWLMDGNIFIRHNGNRMAIRTQDDLDKIM
ncbi:hypothetical protein QE152_g26364 [Popillia japonica]|uniref:Uncharacterized protein n=1 Tax=Popillia japonica TaxID=7064 RepID=A0AAW1JZ39_POPJA